MSVLTPTARCQICWNSGETATFPAVCTAWGATGSQWNSRVGVQHCTIPHYPKQACHMSKWWKKERGKSKLWSGILPLEPCIFGSHTQVPWLYWSKQSYAALHPWRLYLQVNIWSSWNLVCLCGSGGWWPQNQSKHWSLLLSCNLLQINLTQILLHMH